jgi:hypothetical protein
MGSSYIWHNINLPGKKALICLCLFFLALHTCFAQKYTEINLPNSDNHKLTYGFVIGIHASKFKMKYSNYFLNTDSLKSVKPLNFPGFSIGFLINKKIADFFDLRVLPTAGFYENSLKYYYSNSSKTKTAATTYAEMPILIKYKSERRKNFRMYFIGGIKPAFEVTNKTDDEKADINIKKTNISLEYGVGMDIYYPMFKFSPELRFSQGLVNMVDETSTSYYNRPLSSLKTYSVSIFFNFGS